MQDLVAAMERADEDVLQICLLTFGLLSRWAALGLLGMTALVRLTYADG